MHTEESSHAGRIEAIKKDRKSIFLNWRGSRTKSKKVVQSIAKLCLEPKEHSKKITTIIVSSVVDDGLDLKQTKNDSC